jgi:hypothetical protein
MGGASKTYMGGGAKNAQIILAGTPEGKRLLKGSP